MLSPMHVTRVRYLSRTKWKQKFQFLLSLTTSPGPLCGQSLWIFSLWSRQTPWNWPQSPEYHICPCEAKNHKYFQLGAKFAHERGCKCKQFKFCWWSLLLAGWSSCKTAGTCALVVLPPQCSSSAVASPCCTIFFWLRSKSNRNLTKKCYLSKLRLEWTRADPRVIAR